MDKQTWEEWIAEHGRQVVEYVMVCLEDAEWLWDRTTEAEKERDGYLQARDSLQDYLGSANQRNANLQACLDVVEKQRDEALERVACLDEDRLSWQRTAIEAQEERDKAQARPVEGDTQLTKEREESAGWKNVARKRLVEYRELAKAQDKERARIAELARFCSTASPGAEEAAQATAQPKPCLEIADEMVESVAMALRAHETKTPWVQANPSIQAYWRGLARAALEAVKDQLMGACPECAEKDKRIAELELDALATETEMSQARRRIKALESVLRENRKWCEQGRYWGPMAIIDKHLKDHSVTLPDTDADAPATREPEPEPVGDDELREKIGSKLHTLLPHAARATVCIITDEILSLIGSRLTPEIQERLAYLEREHAKFCALYEDYAEEEIAEHFQTRLANGDAAIAVLREYRERFIGENCYAPDMLDNTMADHGILDLITGEQDGACTDCPDNCPSSCDTCGDTAICPQAPVNPVDRVPLPDYLDPSTDDWAALVCTINAIINHLADRELADTQTGAVDSTEDSSS